MPRQRLLAAGLVLCLGPLAVAAASVALTPRLPELSPLGQLCAGIGAVVVSVGCGVGWQVRGRGWVVQRSFLVGAAGVCGLVAGVWWSVATLAVTGDQGMPATWAPVWLLVWPLLVLAAARTACGAVPLVAAATTPDPRLPRVRLPSGAGEDWERSLTAGTFLAGAGLLTVLGAGVSTLSRPVTAVCWTAALLSVLVARLRLRLDSEGLTLSPWGLPIGTRMCYEHIAAARVEWLSPWQWGGRQRVLAGASGVLPRPGPGLVVELADGRRLGIVMPDPVVPAGIINARLDRLHATEAAAR